MTSWWDTKLMLMWTLTTTTTISTLIMTTVSTWEMRRRALKRRWLDRTSISPPSETSRLSSETQRIWSVVYGTLEIKPCHGFAIETSIYWPLGSSRTPAIIAFNAYTMSKRRNGFWRYQMEKLLIKIPLLIGTWWCFLVSVYSFVIRKLKTRVYMNVKFRQRRPVAIPFTFRLSVSFSAKNGFSLSIACVPIKC